jgi:hypothetical protein
MSGPARKAVPLAPTRKEGWMKYICLGYLEPGWFENMSESERIKEYHAKLYDRPAATEPIIESVTITAAIGATEER